MTKTPRERALIQRLKTPEQVQRWLRRMPYNRERGGETLRGFRGVVGRGTAHCLEAALTAATILEHHGYPPTVLSFESQDGLDHVLFVFRKNKTSGPFGAVARSRDEGLHGRAPIFRGPRELAWSYSAPYVDSTGRVTGYALVDLREMGSYDWRYGTKNLWKVEEFLIAYPHRRLPMSDVRYERLHRRYKAHREVHPEGIVDYLREPSWW